MQAMRSLETFVKRVEKLIESMPDSAIVDTGRESPNGVPTTRSGTPSTPSSETWAGWAVSSITKKLVTGDMQPQAVGSPRMGNNSPSPANTPVPSTTSNNGSGMSLSNAGGSNGLKIATEGRNGGGHGGHTINRYSSALAAVEADEAIAGGNGGWGNEDDDLFADEGFEPMEVHEPSTPSPMPSFSTMKPTMAHAPLRPSTNANSSMALGGGSRTGGASARLGFGAMDDSGAGNFNAEVEGYSFGEIK